MFTVYLLQNLSPDNRRYVGITQDVETRLKQHNAGYVKATKAHGPWEVKVRISFQDETKAKQFEKYLKHGSGHAFAKRHFW